MKQITAAILVILPFMLLCKEEKDRTKTERITKAQTGTENSLNTAATRLDTAEVFQTVLALEDSLRKERGNTDLIARLLKASYDSSSGSFYTVGKGVKNPKLPQAAQQQAQERSAQLDAKRWTLYLKRWHTGSSTSFGDSIGGEITYSMIVDEKMNNDTLLQLVQAPVGSVVVD
ncbi:MAG: hypothetical protein GF401_07960 [Chitinivibrionales bacterium]|nr:hypothetical protein [Chitinivibrionales bacterium]